MAFNSVYMVLQELFPQVDPYVLRAVSLQHPEDADVAAEVVLSEILPSLSKQLPTVGSSSNSQSSLSFFDGNGKASQVESTTDQVVINPFATEGSSSVDGSLAGATEVSKQVTLEPTTMSSDHDANSETEANCSGAPILLDSLGASSNVKVDSGSPTSIRESVSLDIQDQVRVKIGGESISNKTLIASESNKFVGIPETDFAATQESDTNSSKASEKDYFAVKFNSEDESAMNSMLTRSELLSRTVYIDEVIEDAKNNKKTLELAMDSVADFLRAVESKEQAAEEANEDAISGCSDILAKVEEVKHALSRAKEHCGEVNAEKAILGTEMRELQTRLFILLDHTNRSLGILDEMRRGLEIRMANALEQIAAAEDKKLERERSAREALLHEERQMEKVVEESKKIKLEAEENSKLQEFLKDRGHAIDILQGEIAVKCEDVLLLKERFDKRMPLSRSLYPTQTTSSVLASSSSSFKSTMSPYEPENETYETPNKTSELGDSFGTLDKSLRSDASHKSSTETATSVIADEEKVDENKQTLDDDDEWELCDNGDLLVR